MPTPYQLDLTAAQVNEAVNKAYDSDNEPAAGQSNLCNGDKIATYVDRKVGDEATAREAADNALEASLTASLFSSKLIKYSLADQTFPSTQVPITGWSENQNPDNLCSVSSGVFTLSAGTYLVMFSARMQDTDMSADRFDIYLRSGGSFGRIYAMENLNNVDGPVCLQYVFAANGSDTFQINLVEANLGTSLIASNIRLTIIPLD